MNLRPHVPGLALGFALLAGGCGVAPEEQEVALIGEASGAIRDGYVDENDKSVVGIVAFFEGLGQAICTGSLIAPNVVLTAQHCVANLENDINGGVLCSSTTFVAPEPPESFLVTTDTILSDDPGRYRAVREVVIPPGDNHVCGNDQAILILDQPMPPEEATPLVPRVDVPLDAGEAYYAVGYGATNDAGSGAGTRRRRDDLFITCVAEGCPEWKVMATEWEGDQGICQGDSGGPSVDLQNRVIGVTSRGTAGCDNPVYGYVYARAQWIKDTTLHAAELGGYEPPPWATGFPTDPAYQAPVGNPCEFAEECAAGVCADGYCSRPCNDIAACPDGFTCEGEGDTSFCVKPRIETRSDDDDSDSDAQGALCSIGQPAPHPTTPIPWLVSAGLGLAALCRRRRAR